VVDLITLMDGRFPSLPSRMLLVSGVVGQILVPKDLQQRRF
jgi:hypothetical protein